MSDHVKSLADDIDAKIIKEFQKFLENKIDHFIEVINGNYNYKAFSGDAIRLSKHMLIECAFEMSKKDQKNYFDFIINFRKLAKENIIMAAIGF